MAIVAKTARNKIRFEPWLAQYKISIAENSRKIKPSEKAVSVAPQYIKVEKRPEPKAQNRGNLEPLFLERSSPIL